MQFVRRHKKILTGLLVVIALLLLAIAWYPYQKHEATAYLNGQGCDPATNYSNDCSDTCVTLTKVDEGLAVHYSYMPLNGACDQVEAGVAPGCDGLAAPIYSGKVISIPGKHFISDAQAVALDYKPAC